MIDDEGMVAVCLHGASWTSWVNQHDPRKTPYDLESRCALGFPYEETCGNHKRPPLAVQVCCFAQFLVNLRPYTFFSSL